MIADENFVRRDGLSARLLASSRGQLSAVSCELSA